MKTILPGGLFLLCFSLQLTAQTTRLTGRALDETGQSLALATVALLDAADSSLVAGRYCDADGNYTFEAVAPGRYWVQVSLLGYQAANSPAILVEAGSGRQTVPDIRLFSTTTTLGTAEIKASKPLFEAQLDRLTVNIAGKISATGLSALDLLQRCPGVVVNRQNNTLNLAGKQGVVVMINGKASRLPPNAVIAMLSGMNASNIEKIELITTPPSGFDAEGDAGFINIVLKKNIDEGLNGSYNLLAGYGYGEKLGAGIIFNYRASRWNLFGDYNFSHDRHWQEFRNYRLIRQPDGSETENKVSSIRKPIDDNHTARLGLDVDLGKKTVLGVLASGYQTLWQMDAQNTGFTAQNGNVETRLFMPNVETNRWRHLMGNLNLQHTFRSEETLTADFDYLWYRDHNPTDYIVENRDAAGSVLSTEALRSRKETPIRFQVGKLDYARQINKNLRMETGIKATFSQFNNDVSVENQLTPGGDWMVLPDYTNRYRLREDISAAYGSLRYDFGNNSLQAGLRYEYTNSVLTGGEETLVDRHYGNLFPTLFYGYDPNEKHHFGLAYKRRITRPTFNDLAPFVIFLDPNTYLSGNAALQPAFTDGIKAEYRYKSYLLSLEYSRDDNPIANFQPTIDPDQNRQTFIAANMKSRDNIGMSFTAPFHPTPWWEIQSNLTGSWQNIQTTYEGRPVRLQQLSGSAYIGQTFHLPRQFNIDLSTLYYTPGYFGLSEFQHYFLLDAGIQKDLGRSWGNFRLAFSNILNTNYYRGVIDLPDNGLYSTFDIILEPPAVRLSWSRQFGSEKVKTARQREAGSEDERRRVKG